MTTHTLVSVNKRVYSRIALFGSILFFALGASAGAQETTALEELPGLRERAVVLKIVARIVEQNEQVVWNSENARITIPGKPVGLKLVSSDLVVAVQFTPYLRHTGKHILVTQSQIWLNIPNEGMDYRTTMQTIPLEFREQIYFFPLGSMKEKEGPKIEIQLTMEPYLINSENIDRNRKRVNSP